jgi:hypothetical protein
VLETRKSSRDLPSHFTKAEENTYAPPPNSRRNGASAALAFAPAEKYAVFRTGNLYHVVRWDEGPYYVNSLVGGTF